MKYLGLHLDPHLKWDIHGRHVQQKLSMASSIMWKLKNVLPFTAKKKIYHSLFATHINYMITVWGNACDTVIKPIQIIQKPVKIDGFMINNAEDMKGDKTMWIQNSSSNSLILKMDLGWTIELKCTKNSQQIIFSPFAQ